MEWILEYWQALTWGRIVFGVGLFVFSVVFSLLLVAIIIVKIPANYFSPHFQQDFMPNTPWIVRWGAVIGKNIAGLVLILAGIAMLIGPGQGVLTILVGLILLDIPGKRPLEARIIKRPTILSAVNKLRAKYEKPSLILD